MDKIKKKDKNRKNDKIFSVNDVISVNLKCNELFIIVINFFLDKQNKSIFVCNYGWLLLYYY